ncbi:hypothetical protein GCM10023353_30780 [Tomitella cavernea]|uniref:Antitoxin n=1 Tax=Tomitella cavernea TaxID=1387982 RepID=A0ABP9CVY9_9ACTN
MQIRDVPEEVHTALASAAAEQGLSLTGYLLRELKRTAARTQTAAKNAEVIRRTQQRVVASVDRDTILDALDEGRG